MTTSASGDDSLEHVRQVTQSSGTSFFWAMRLLPERRRDAMFAVYAFCREVDDIADAEGPPAEKAEGLEAWRAEIGRLYDGRPDIPHGQGPRRADRGIRARESRLPGLDRRHGNGCGGSHPGAVDDRARVLLRPRVACAVGRLSVKVFGATEPEAKDVAFSLGQALQLTNILRDPREDATRGRLYLPRELLDKHGIETREPNAVLDHPNLPGVCRDLAAVAKRRFAEADQALAKCARRPMRPAIVMKEVYRRYLDKLIEGDWQDIDHRVSLPKIHKLWIGLRHGLL